MTSPSTIARASAAHARSALSRLPAQQQPVWRDQPGREHALTALARAEPIVSEQEVAALRASLRSVADGHALVLQAGDCAEPMTDTGTAVVEAKANALDEMGRVLAARAGRPVVRIGRIAGQFSKPRTQPHETINGDAIPAYRGALVNDPYPTARAREHEPRRLVRGRAASDTIAQILRRRRGERVWTSHEALVLDYELPQLRRTADDEILLTSAHTVWIGARTNQLDHAHVGLASIVANPVGCKVTGSTTVDDLRALLRAIDPGRETGRVMLIARMGAAVDRLPALMEAVRSEGHPVIWMSDPMHANTVTAADGRKTRYVTTIAGELAAFQDACRSAGVPAGGAHLETTVDDVRECLLDAQDVRERHEPYTTLCDPRLTTAQAVEVLQHWRAA